jgi:alkylglycerol monooxygenase
MTITNVLILLAGVCGLAYEVLRRRARRQTTDWTSIALSLKVGAIRYVAGFATQALFIGAVLAFFGRFAIFHLPADNPLVWIGFFLGADFVDYWVHRAEHRIPVLWASHVVHHSTEDFNFSAAARLSPVEALYHPLMAIWAIVLGVPVVIYAPVTAISLFIGLFGHTKSVGKLGILDRLISTPSAHRVHHGKNSEYIDKNFGSALLIWDRMFGTYEPEVAPVVFGVTTPIDTSSTLRTALGGYPAWFSKRPESIGMPAVVRQRQVVGS